VTWQILQGDCIEKMRELEAESVDSIVTDPPYGIGFMGHEWDQPGEHQATATGGGGKRGHSTNFGKGEPGDAASAAAMDAGRYDLSPTANQKFARWTEAWAAEAFRVLKPGGYLLSFAGTRTYHRMVCGIEDAGFEIRDQIAWMFGSGFPKSLDVSKAIDKAAGVEGSWRQEDHPGRAGVRKRDDSKSNFGQTDYGAEGNERHVYEPGSDAAKQWQGWGTALKPAFEPIVVARKPLIGTVAANVLEHGTGAINVDGCRVEHDGTGSWGTVNKGDSRSVYGSFGDEDGETPGSTRNPAGRWPANVVLDPEAGELLDAQTGESTSRIGKPRGGTPGEGWGIGTRVGTEYDDHGGASRFFYCAKTSSAERNAGLDGFEPGDRVHFGSGGRTQVDGEWVETHSEPQKRANVHPTVNPIALMRWLCRLVTPPGGTILDPFNGSGSTGCAAVLEGFNYIGCEREAEYVAIAEARVKWWEQHPEGVELAERIKAEKARAEVEAAGQASLFGEEAA
jgi:site-specific DNA-methyltransferase (adenine-specific)